MKQLLIIYLLLFFLCLSVHSEAPKTLKVFGGIEGYSEAPFSMWKKGEAEPRGLDPDILRLVAKEMKVELSFFKIDLTKGWVDLRREVIEAELVDVLAYAYSVTNERKKHVSFSDPYLISTMNALVLKASKISSIKDLENQAVLALGHTTAFPWAKKNIKGKIYADFPEDFHGSINDLLKNKTIGAYLGDYESLLAMAKQDENLKVVKQPLQKEYIAIAASKGNKKLLEKINKALAKLEKNGELKKLRKKYFESPKKIEK